jgi:gliding motility-associated protein GldL
MAKKKGFLDSRAFKIIMKYVYGLGAAVVIAGALFKIMHWPFANEMLIAGMGTEVLVFFVSAFEPLHAEMDWSRVYPQLAEDTDAEFSFDDETDSLSTEEALLQAEAGLKEIEISPELFESLSGSLNGLRDNVSKLANIEDATLATNEYTSQMQEASSKVAQLNTNYTSTVDAMSSMATTVGAAAAGASAYQEQVTAVTKNLSSLNAIYELEMQDAEKHMKALNQFYDGLAQAMKSVTESAADTATYQDEVAKLTQNIKALNGVYGGMLSAMGGGNANG